jgi:hypothetical protein
VSHRIHAVERVGVALCLALGLLVTVAPGSAQAGTQHCVLKITRFAWHPPEVHEGDTSKARVKAKNCTDRTLQLRRTVYGEMHPPCPTIDPLSTDMTIGPYARYAAIALKMIAPDCNGVEVLVVAFANQHGTILAHDTATLHITSPSPVRKPDEGRWPGPAWPSGRWDAASHA